MWTHGDVTDSQGACKKCYHKHLWAGHPQSRDERTGLEADTLDGTALWEIGMEAEIEALGCGVCPEDLW